MRTTVLAVLALLIASACAGPAASPSPVPSTAPVVTPRPPDVAPETPPDIPGIPTGLLNTIRAEGARLARVSVNEVGVVAATQVTWNDGSLGCPLPDEMYTQAVIRGYQIIVEAGGREFDFRVADNGSFRLCDPAPTEGPTPIQPPDPY